MSKWMTACTAMLLFAGTGPAQTTTAEGELGVGSKAPRLGDVHWIQGEPVTEWQAGQVYVLDFWATWCGPCKATIPHVSELSKKYADDGVNVIGVAIWPRESMVPTAEFVQQKSGEMAYRIAEDIDGKTAEAFMRASLSSGIPTVMIVNRAGRLAWIGHPMEVDEPLAQVVAGTADMDAFIAADKSRRAQEVAKTTVLPRINAAYKARDWPAALAAAEDLVRLDPANPTFLRTKYSLLAESGDAGGAAKFGHSILGGALKHNATGLNELAWFIVDPRGVLEAEQRDLALALAAAVRADELTGHKDASVLDTLARVHFHKGDVDKAIELQKQALELATTEERPYLQPALDEYTAAAAARG
ncbi:MAG: redoxin domain-containing protein [Planctomycetota bacterium]|jgi:thiol-disulfide isomerase/thioredoxin